MRLPRRRLRRPRNTKKLNKIDNTKKGKSMTGQQPIPQGFNVPFDYFDPRRHVPPVKRHPGRRRP
jgi:hypothetical protein